MNEREKDKLSAFRNVREFGVTHATSFPAGCFGAEVLVNMGVGIKRIESHNIDQFSGINTTQESETSKAVLRESLHENLEATNRTARSMASKIVGIADKFRMPESRSTEALLTAAKAFLQNAEPLAAEFIRRGMSADFLDHLKSDIEQLEQFVNMKLHSKDQRVVANAARSEDIKTCMGYMEELDAYIRNVFHDDKVMMAAWENAKHIPRISRSSTKPAPVPESEQTIEPAGEKS